MATTISSSTSYTLGANEDNLQLTGTANINGSGNELNNILTGNLNANILKGMAGADTLYGGDSSDTLYAGDGVNVSDTLRDVLYGGTGNDALFADGGDALYGEAGNDVLNASSSKGNLLDGGAGNDLYRVYAADNVINESVSGGTDTIETTLSVNLALFDASGPAMAGALNVTGAVENVKLAGSMNVNITGNSLANVLTANAGANILKGMTGADTLNAGDGNDTLYAGATTSDTGDSSIDMLYGGNGNDTLYADGCDQIYGDAGNDTLIVNAAKNNILYGGAGDDVYIVNQTNNFIVEQSNSGIDTVQSDAVSINLQGFTPVANAINTTGEIEKLSLTGTANIDGYGNNLANTITGNSGNNVLQGGYGADLILGGAGNDTLYASAPGQAESMLADTLDGGVGDDTYYLDGADWVWEFSSPTNGGNDTYIVDGLANRVCDNSGHNVVMSSVSFSNQYLVVPTPTGNVVEAGWSVSSSSIETIELTGSLNTKALGSSSYPYINGSPIVETLLGNSGDNVLEGCGGDDVLDGRAGNDTLVMYADTVFSYVFGQKNAITTGKASWTGGDGQDTFWIGKAYLGDHSSGANQLTITDFTHGVDTLRLGISASSTAPVTLNTITATATDTLATLLNKASLAGSAATPTLTQFEFAGNTYLVLDQNSAATFTASTDLAISLTGTPGLTLSDVVFAAV